MTVTRKTRAQSVADRIRTDILLGEVRSGDRLAEAHLADRFDVSQNTVRDALRIIDAEGWTVKRARRGTHVRTFTRKEADEIYQLLGAVEEVALQWGLERLATKGLGPLQRTVSSARHHVQIGNLRETVEALFLVHRIIGQAADRPQTTLLVDRLLNQARLLEGIRLERAPRAYRQQKQVVLVHEQLVESIARRDGARTVLRDILETERMQMLAALYS